MAWGGGFYEESTRDIPHYVCFDGRALVCTPTGFVWQAKRGCFLSRMACDERHATLYGYYASRQRVVHAYAQCRADYPFRLGEMQTH